MARRASRFLVLTTAIASIVMTIGAPGLDGLSRAVAKVFRERAPDSSWTFAPVSVDFLDPSDPEDIAAAIDASKLTFQVPPDTPRGSGSLAFQSLPTGTPLTTQPAGERASPPGVFMTSLYSSFIALQALDAHSTIRALDRGARETNPVIAPFADNTAALIALKAGTAVGVVYMTERVRRHNRVASIVIMAAANSAYATIVARNYRIGATQPSR